MNQFACKYTIAKVTATIFFCVLVFFHSEIQAQNVSLSVNNSTNYGIGNEFGFSGKEEKEYFESFTDLRLRSSNITVGVRMELRKPAEFGPDEQAITRRYVEYRKEGLRLRAGDLYTLFNRGLSLNLFENRIIRYDTRLDGMLAEFETGMFGFSVVGGEIEYIEQLTFDEPNIHTERHSLRAAKMSFSPSRSFNITGSFLRSESAVPEYPFTIGFSDTVSVRNHIPEASVNVRLPFADFHVGYSYKFTEYADSLESHGGGFYASISQTGRGYGVTLEFKDYRYNISDPFQEANFLRPERMLPFQNPPIAHREHSYTLMSREPHLVNFNDETGFFLDAFYSVSPRLLMNASLALASRHYAFELDNDTFEFNRVNRSNSWMPSLDRDKNPFFEVYTEGTYLLSDFISYVKLAYNYRYRYENDPYAPEFSTDLKIHNILAEVSYSLTPIWSVKLSSEHQFVYNSIYAANPNKYNQLITLQVAKSPTLSLSGRFEFTDTEDELSGRTSWFFVEGSYRIGQSHTIAAGYGSDRGGVVCTNGVCRVINAFDGFRFSLTSTF